ncbi:MAG: M13 family metallopeptidase [Burkholderiaceae bacterium]|nr:M13 family metallopeptidase [Burkholderiaceae bacterium]
MSLIRLTAAVVSAALSAPAALAADPPLACTDFYRYVNGDWLKQAQIAPDRARTGTFEELREANTQRLLGVLAQVRTGDALLDTPAKQLAVAYFASGMDTASIERRGLESLQPLLAAIDALDSPAQLPALLARLARAGISGPFGVWIGPDAADKRRYRLSLAQSGLGLPDRDDYGRDDERTRALRRALDAYQARLLVLGGADAAAADAQAIAAIRGFEARLAAASLTRVAMRDPKAVYNPRTAEQLAAEAPGFDWAAFLRGLGLADGATVNVGQPVLDAAAPRLPGAYADAHFAFHSASVLGLQKKPPSERQVIDDISGRTGAMPLAEGLGQLFVAESFSPQGKARAEQMVADIKAAFRARIERLDWMSAPTKARAIAKLDALALKIGYPGRWKTYDGLAIRADDYAGNWLRANEWNYADRLAAIDSPVDRGRWNTSPHIVNAFAGGLNDITFPAGIMQPPFFDGAGDTAANYGAIGAVIGHEITHHFDDRGRQFDEHGNLAPWWSEADVAAYRERAAMLAAQFSRYAPLPGQFINGRQTLGENISDLGGLAIAYDALQAALAREAGRGDRAPDRSAEQRFFIAYATIWRDRTREQALLNQLRTGNHSPARYRVIGTLANVDGFGKAFGCPAGSPMLQAERVSIW